MNHDAIIIGSGINGLACAVCLAKAGWKVLVLERNDVPGGAVQTAEVTLPGFKHDLYATNLSLFAGSPFNQQFGADLARHGLEFVNAPHTFSSVFPDGTCAGVSMELDTTLASIGALSQADADRWRDMAAVFPDRAGRIFPVLNSRLPSLSMAKVMLANLGTGGVEWLQEIRDLFMSTPRRFADRNFTDARVQSLAAAWGLHLDFAPDTAGGALFPYLECMANQAFGMSFAKGGAGRLVGAMTGLLRELGGDVRLNAEAAAIISRNGRAAGVELVDGEFLGAQRAMIANLTPAPLHRLLRNVTVSNRFRSRLQRYRYGPGTMMIHLAMDDLPAWTAGEALRRFAYVHIAPYVDDLSRAYAESMAKRLPASPLLVVAQPTVIDPSRAPAGKHVLSIQVRTLPPEIRGDARNEISGHNWDEVKEAYADRVLDKLEAYAPGTREKILGRSVISPADIERANPNLVGGCNIGGSMHLDQNFLFRPFLGGSGYRTPLRDLYMIGAGTWPGGGTGAGSGWLLGGYLTKR